MTTPSFFGYGLSPAIQLAEIWEVISDFTLPSQTGIITLPISPAIDFNDVSMVVIEAELISASGTGNQVLLRVNGVSANNYDVDGRTIKAGVETIINETGTGYKIANLTLFQNVNDTVHLLAYLQLNKTGTNKRIGIQSFANGLQQNGNMNISGVLTIDQTELNEIELLVFSAGFVAGTKITVYKVKRKL